MPDLVIRREAEADLRQAFEFYESCRRGLGREFLRCVEVGLQTLRRAPARYRLVHRHVRRLIIRRFPYGIFFTVTREHIIVIAVMHVRRVPSSWASRTIFRDDAFP